MRTTTASNAGPADGFVKRAFNETPGDGIPVAPCSCRLFSPLSLSFVVRFWPPQHMRSALMLARSMHTNVCKSANDHVRYRTRDISVILRSAFCFPSFSRHRYFPTLAFFPSRAVFPVHFSVPFIGTMHDAFDNGQTAIATRVKRRGIRPIRPINMEIAGVFSLFVMQGESR